MNNHHTNHDELSERGCARRDAMLAELSPLVRRAARARRVRSGATAAAALLAIVSLGFLIPSTFTPHHPEQAAVDPPIEPASRIEIVSTDAGVLDRLAWSAPSGASRIERISDEELIFVLAEMGRPAGLIRSQGRVWLTAVVTDGDLNPDPPNTSNSG